MTMTTDDVIRINILTAIHFLLAERRSFTSPFCFLFFHFASVHFYHLQDGTNNFILSQLLAIEFHGCTATNTIPFGVKSNLCFGARKETRQTHCLMTTFLPDKKRIRIRNILKEEMRNN